MNGRAHATVCACVQAAVVTTPSSPRPPSLMQYGYCGATAAHCGAGCQKGYGQCNKQHVAPPLAPCTAHPGFQ